MFEYPFFLGEYSDAYFLIKPHTNYIMIIII